MSRNVQQSKPVREAFRKGKGTHKDPNSLRTSVHYCALPEGEHFDTMPIGRPMRLCLRDDRSTEFGIDTLNELGLPVSPHATGRAYNAADGDDILKKAYPGDIVFFHRPFVGGTLSTLMNKFRLPGFKHSDAHLYWQSPLSFTPDNWHKCAVASEAKVIINVTDNPFRNELPTAYLDKPPYWHGLTRNFALEGLNGGVLGYSLHFLFHEAWAPAQELRKYLPQKAKKTLPLGLSWLRNALQN